MRVAAAPTLTLRTALVAIWAIGALVVLARLAIGTIAVARLARRGDRIDDGRWLSLAQRLATTLRISRPLILLRGDRIGVPITWGIVYPIVLLPDDADSWPEDRRRFVLVHEMAHVKRLDAITQLVGQVVLAVFWFNPLVWIANRRMQLEREHACDDYVLRHGTQPSQYAADLLDMVRALGTLEHRGAQPAFAALAMARRSEFEGRMLSILDPALDRHPLSRGRTLMSAFAALLVVVPLAALQPYRAAPAAAAAPASAAPAGTTAPIAEQIPAVPSAHENARPHAPLSTQVEKKNSLDKLLAADVATLGRAVKSDAARTAALTTDTMRACEAVAFGSRSRTSTHVHSDDDASGRQLNYLNVNADRCTQAMLAGKVTYTANEEDVAALGTGARAFFRERSAQDDRSVSITRGEGGALVRAYRRNGVDAPYDYARRWLAGFLPILLAETAENVGPRVARWRAEGGVDDVLRHLVALRSSGARRAHYEALLDQGKLSSTELDRVVRSASESMRTSSGDLRAVLTRAAAPSARFSQESKSALESALVAMGSSGDKSAVLQIYGQTNDRDMLLAVMRVAQTIGSSGDRARLLQVLAPRYLTKSDRALEAAYFDGIGEIASPGDMRNTLMVAIQYAAKSADVTRRIIQGARTVSSSGDQSSVLIALVSSGAVNTRELRDAFLKVAAEVPSDGDRSRVLQSAAGMTQ